MSFHPDYVAFIVILEDLRTPLVEFAALPSVVPNLRRLTITVTTPESRGCEELEAEAKG